MAKFQPAPTGKVFIEIPDDRPEVRQASHTITLDLNGVDPGLSRTEFRRELAMFMTSIFDPGQSEITVAVRFEDECPDCGHLGYDRLADAQDDGFAGNCRNPNCVGNAPSND